MYSGLRPDTVVLELPFRGLWRVENSPARRVPSHGTTAFGSSHAIDFVKVDETGRSAPFTWRAAVAPEPPEQFLGFGVPILSPVPGRVVAIHDHEPDHAGRRSQLLLLPYMLGQAKRARNGAAGLAGNHVVVAAGDRGPFVLVAHLKRDSIQVSVGDEISTLDAIGQCGNSGNSTEPHVHVQVSDSMNWASSQGVPLAFRRADGTVWLPNESEIVRA
ncbi:M23 family metallopeptidase [Arthrobacter sp. Br18]|uniref:M23 family metallopeptidase n=1 Tax=Arthrobacter sp. Br18 TaxID=1312954 RepID=UPI0005697233|nr:M23 family metallopeptidase [Arthrobacter sp. Br18]